MQKIEINPFDLSIHPHHLFDRQSLLLAAGDFAQDDFNVMTIGWGSIGTMWNKPFVEVVVRPTRYTYKFMEEYEDFTVSAFPREHKRALSYLGTRSGRDSNKLAETDLTAIAAARVKSPAFEQAELTIECRTIYTARFDPTRFLDPAIEKSYPEKDYHFIYYGEIVMITGTEKFLSQK
ncbi:MAG: flavin reductase [Anaerolineaceae bacterium]|jgi:flavin reductase (DIM6/NTAB) family NADH-FMN oxidoreductase RutF|nr:flavin reductase [Anaerolineaceae bacterium]